MALKYPKKKTYGTILTNKNKPVIKATRSNSAEWRCRISLRVKMSVAVFGGVLWQQRPDNVNLYPLTPSSKNIRPCRGLISSEATKPGCLTRERVEGKITPASSSWRLPSA
jgi:hypothetical protein